MLSYGRRVRMVNRGGWARTRHNRLNTNTAITRSGCRNELIGCNKWPSSNAINTTKIITILNAL